jgi:hypothetical protein
VNVERSFNETAAQASETAEILDVPSLRPVSAQLIIVFQLQFRLASFVSLVPQWLDLHAPAVTQCAVDIDILVRLDNDSPEKKDES